jgi:acyl dehydratase
VSTGENDMSAPNLEEVVVAEDWVVGDRLPSLHRKIDLPTLVRYAGASGDYNPIHYDESYASAAGLDSVIGHGMLAMALVSEVVTDWAGDSGLVRELAVRFASPYRLGDVLTVAGEVTGRSVDDEGRVSVDVTLSCVNQDGTEIVRDAAATVRSR